MNKAGQQILSCSTTQATVPTQANASGVRVSAMDSLAGSTSQQSLGTAVSFKFFFTNPNLPRSTTLLCGISRLELEETKMRHDRNVVKSSDVAVGRHWTD